MTGIGLIIQDLARTTKKFTTGVLCRKYSMSVIGTSKPLENDEFCANGVLTAEAGVPDSDIKDHSTSVRDINNALPLLRKRYHVGFTDPYKTRISCYMCSSSPSESLGSLEQVIMHGNDKHSVSHKGVADYIKNMSKKYDLITGEKIF